MKELKVKLTLTEPMLGTTSGNPKIQEEYVAAKIFDGKNLDNLGISAEEANERIDEEVSVLDEVEKTMTVFPKLDDGTPFVWDYQIKGFFKDACSMLKKIPKTKSAGCKAFKKEIDGLIFIDERRIPINLSGEMSSLQRPLRASTPLGERVALANSESVPAGSTLEFTILVMVDSDLDMVKEWMDYGRMRGLGQWRNASFGRFTYEVISET